MALASPDRPQPAIQTPDRLRPVRNLYEKVKHSLGRKETKMVESGGEALALGQGEEGLKEIKEIAETQSTEAVQPLPQNGQITEANLPNLTGTESPGKTEVNPAPSGVQTDITAEALDATVQEPVTTPSETPTDLPKAQEVDASPVTENGAETPQTLEQKPRTPQEILQLLPTQTRAELTKLLEIKEALAGEPQSDQRVTDLPIHDVQNQLRDLIVRLSYAKDDQIPQIIDKINTFRSENHLAKADLLNQQRVDEVSRDKEIADTRAEIDQEFGSGVDLDRHKMDLENELDMEKNHRSGIIKAFRGKHRTELEQKIERVNQALKKRRYVGDDLQIKMEYRKRQIEGVESFDVQAKIQEAIVKRFELTGYEVLVYEDVVQNSAEIYRKLGLQALESLANNPDFMDDVGWSLSGGDLNPEDLYGAITYGTEIAAVYGNNKTEYSESSFVGQLTPKLSDAQRILTKIIGRGTDERSFVGDITVLAKREAMDYYENRLRDFFVAAGLPAEGQSAFNSFDARRNARTPIETERLQETSEYWMKIVNNPSVHLSLPDQVIEGVSRKLRETGNISHDDNLGNQTEKSDESEEASKGRATFDKVISIIRLKQEGNGEELLHLYTDQDPHIREIAGRALMYVGRKENPQLIETVADRLGVDPRLKEAFVNAALPTESLNHQYQVLKILSQNPKLAEKFIQGDDSMIQHLLQITGREDYEQVGKVLAGLLTQEIQSPRDVFKYTLMTENRDINFDEKFMISTIPGLDDYLQWAKLSPERRKQFLYATGNTADELAASDSVST